MAFRPLEDDKPKSRFTPIPSQEFSRLKPLPEEQPAKRKIFGYEPKPAWAQKLLEVVKWPQEQAHKTADMLLPEGKANLPTLAASAAAGPIGLPILAAQKALMKPRESYKEAVDTYISPEGMTVLGAGAGLNAAVGPTLKESKLMRDAGIKIIKEGKKGLHFGEGIHFAPASRTKTGKIYYHPKATAHSAIGQPALESKNAASIFGGESGWLTRGGKFTVSNTEGGPESVIGKRVLKHFEETGKFPTLPERELITRQVAKEVAAKENIGKKPVMSVINQVLPERRALIRQAPISGRKIVEASADAAADAQTIEGRLINRTLKKSDLEMTPKQQSAIKTYIQTGNKTDALDDQALDLAKRLQKGFKKSGKLARLRKVKVNAGTDQEKIIQLRDNYYPNAPDETAYQDPAKRLEQINAWMADPKTKKYVPTVEAGEEIIDRALQIQDGTLKLSDLTTHTKDIAKSGALENHRKFGFIYTNPDPVDAFINYTQRTAKRVAEVKHYGQNGEKLFDLADQAVLEGANKDFVNTSLETLLGTRKIDESSTNFWRGVRQIQAATKMQTSGIINAQQGTSNSLIRSGGNIPVVTKGTKDAFTKEGIQFALETGGVKGRDVTKYQDEILGLAGKKGKLDKLNDMVQTLNVMKHSETGNRIQAANIGRRYVLESLIPRFMKDPKNAKVLEELKEFRLSPQSILAKGGKLSRSEQIRAANEWVAQTQFGLRPGAVPQFMSSSEVGKTVGQYGSFIYQQGSLDAQAIKKYPVRAPLAIAGTGLTLNKGLKAIQSFISGREPEYKTSLLEDIQNGNHKQAAKRVAKDILESGAGGKAGSVLLSSQYGPQSIMSAVLGPTFGGDLWSAGKVLTTATTNPTKLPSVVGQEVTKRIPIVGQSIKNRIFPSLVKDEKKGPPKKYKKK